MTVTALNEYIRSITAKDAALSDILISGELSGFTRHISGHCFFTLKDDASQIKGIMFSGVASKLPYEPKNGMKVIVRGSVQVFVRDGIYQIYATDMQPDGYGALFIAMEQLKKKLFEEGLFDPAHKKPLPVLPQRIGVVTAKGGAALQDIINIVGRRCPMTELVVFGCGVQGAQAAQGIVDRLIQADSYGVDVIICGRGGGSPEDLMVFNDERIARTVYAMKTPVISAVGHETDTTLIDFVSDVRAPTPSAAAEIAVPSMESLKKNVSDRIAMMKYHMTAVEMRKKRDIAEREQRLRALYPAYRFTVMDKTIKERQEMLRKAVQTYLSGRAALCVNTENALVQKYADVTTAKAALLAKYAAALDALSPLRTLQRGFGIVYKDDRVIRSSKDLSEGDELRIQFAEGSAAATVKEITHEL